MQSQLSSIQQNNSFRIRSQEVLDPDLEISRRQRKAFHSLHLIQIQLEVMTHSIIPIVFLKTYIYFTQIGLTGLISQQIVVFA